MALKKRVAEVTNTNDIYYIAYEDDNFVYILDDEQAFQIEQESKDNKSQDRNLAVSADLIIDKKTRRVIHARWF